MAILASHTARIPKTDGLLARAGELCGMIGASYLSPFFPFVLGFALWRYLRPQLQTGDRSVLTRNNRGSDSRSRFRNDAEAAGLQRVCENSALVPKGRLNLAQDDSPGCGVVCRACSAVWK